MVLLHFNAEKSFRFWYQYWLEPDERSEFGFLESVRLLDRRRLRILLNFETCQSLG